MGKFLTFTFDGINSSKYNVYIVNEGDSITLPSSPSFTDQVAAPAYQNTVYYLGTTLASKVFTVKCLAKSVTMTQYQEMMKWLSIEKVGKLILDNAPYFYSTVKISRFSETSLLGEWDSLTDTYQAIFELQFTTIGDYAQQNLDIYNYNLDIPYNTYNCLDPVYNLPMIWYDNTIRAMDTKEVYLVNYNSLPMYLDIKVGATSAFSVWKHANRKPVEKGTWKTETRNINGVNKQVAIATSIDGEETWELEEIPEENDIYFVTTEESEFCKRKYEKDSILIARHGSWFKETKATICDDLYYNYDMINFEPGSDSLWTWKTYDVKIKSQYGFITDLKDNKLIEVTINQQLEKLEDIPQFKGIPDYFNNGALQVEPTDITFIPVNAKLDCSRRDPVSIRKYWIDFTAENSLLLNLTRIPENGEKLGSGEDKYKSFIYFTYSELDENGNYEYKKKFIEIIDDSTIFTTTGTENNNLHYVLNVQQYKEMEELLNKENIQIQIVTFIASIIKIGSLLTANYNKEITLTQFPCLIGGNKQDSVLYMLGFDTIADSMLDDEKFPTQRLLDTDIEYLHYLNKTNSTEEGWYINRTYNRLPAKDIDLVYEEFLVDLGWESDKYTNSLPESISASNVDTLGRTFLETQEKFNQGINTLWTNYTPRNTVKCRVDLSTVPMRKPNGRSAKIWSNCFKELTEAQRGSDVEGMYQYNGHIYIQINKSRLTSSVDFSWKDVSKIAKGIQNYLISIGCFFLYEVDRHNIRLEEYDQKTLESSATDQVIYGHSEHDNVTPKPTKTNQRKYWSDPSNVFILRQKESSLELELKLRNQF